MRARVCPAVAPITAPPPPTAPRFACQGWGGVGILGVVARYDVFSDMEDRVLAVRRVCGGRSAREGA